MPQLIVDLSEIAIQIFGYAIGGIISVTVGILVVHYTNKKRDQDWVKQNVYRKFFNYVEKDIKKIELEKDINTEWDTVEPFVRINIDSEISSQIDVVYDGVVKWNKLLEHLRKSLPHSSYVNEQITAVFRSLHLLKGNDIVLKDNHLFRLEDWIENYLPVLIDPSNISADKLKENLKKYVPPLNDWLIEQLDYFESKNSKFFSLLFSQISEIYESEDLHTNFTLVREQKSILLADYKKLHALLVPKIKN